MKVTKSDTEFCKVRRVKCDEARPLCKRCAKAGRKCEGYAPEDSVGQSNEVADDRVSTSKVADRQVEELVRQSTNENTGMDVEDLSNSKLPIHLESSSNEDLRFLEFFYQRTAPHISGFYDDEFYNRFLLQAGQHEESIRHAMIACGAMHEHYEFEIVPALDGKIEKVIAPKKPDAVLESYNKAIRGLMRQLSSTTGSVETVAMCCLLFTCLECLRGDPQSAAAHLRSGGNILAAWMSRNRTIEGCKSGQTLITPTSKDPQYVKDRLVPIFQRLGALVINAGRLSTLELSKLAREDLMVAEEELAAFESISDARNSLLNLLALGARHAGVLAQGKYTGGAPEEEVRALYGLRQKFTNWDVAFEKYLDSADETILHSRRVLVLQIHRRLYNPILARALLPEECGYDEHLEDWAFVVEAGERLLNLDPATSSLEDQELGTFSFEEGISGTLFFTATKCRDPIIRRKAIRLLTDGPARQGIWNSRLFAKVAQRLAEYEENYKAPALSSFSSSGEGSVQTDQSGQPPESLLTPESLRKPSRTPDPVESSAQRTGASAIPEEARIHNANISESPHENPHHHTVTFISKPNGLQEEWQSWTEDVSIPD